MSEDIAAVEARDDETNPDVADVYEVDDAGIDTEQLSREIVELMWDLKALNPIAIDLRGRVSYTDFCIVGTGTSERHVRALGKHIHEKLTDAGWTPLSVEGLNTGGWAILDFGDVIIHVFDADAREAYDLESMWVDADRLEFDDRPEELYGHFHADRFDDEGF